jgi:hypothetical protein
MKRKSAVTYSRIAMIAPIVLAMSAASSFAAERFTAKLQPMNAGKIGTSTTGTATFEISDGKLTVSIDLAGLPPNMMHLQHFHGFPDGKAASCPTDAADTNGDGYIDLAETEPSSGTTMVPFHAHPATLEIASDTYPVADKSGVAHYTETVSVADLDAALKAKFKAPSLALDKRVVFIHGVANNPALPGSVKSLPGVPANITIPIACGKIEAVK